jgi:predicted dehydrogenase
VSPRGGLARTEAQDGGGVLMSQGIHYVALLLWLMGADPVHSSARGDPPTADRGGGLRLVVSLAGGSYHPA